MEKKKKILVTGAGGQLGSSIRDLAGQYPSCEFIMMSRVEMPVDDMRAVERVFDLYKPDYCINAAAYTAVDKAESEKELAFLINATAAANLARACRQTGSTLIHISTDYVFQGNGTAPYKEDEPVDPLNVYGASKAEGEKLALAEHDRTYIIRTSWLYGRHGHNFVKTMQRLMGEREKLGVVNDQFGCPTNAEDLAGVIIKIILAEKTIPFGIYHFSNSGITTWFGFASAIKEIIGSACEVYPVDTSSFPTPARRPSYSVMDTSRISDALGIKIPGWRESLERYFK